MKEASYSFVLDTSYRCTRLTNYLNHHYPNRLKSQRGDVHTFLTELTILEVNTRLAWVVIYKRDNYNQHLKSLVIEHLGLSDEDADEFLDSDELIDLEESFRVVIDKFICEGSWLELYFTPLHNGVLIANSGDYRINMYNKHMASLDPEVYEYANGINRKYRHP